MVERNFFITQISQKTRDLVGGFVYRVEKKNALNVWGEPKIGIIVRGHIYTYRHSSEKSDFLVYYYYILTFKIVTFKSLGGMVHFWVLASVISRIS